MIEAVTGWPIQASPGSPAAPGSAATTPGSAGGPTYLYQLNDGALAPITGTQRTYAQDGFQSANSTSFRVSCSAGELLPTTFRSVPGARRLTGTLLLDSQATPPDLAVDVDLLADGKRIGHWRLRPGDRQKLSQNIRGASALELDAVRVAGTCGLAAQGYGVVVDGAVS